MSLIGKKYRVYTPLEADTIRRMLRIEGSRELGLGIIINSGKRFREDDRRALYRELHLLKNQLGTAYYRWGYMSSQVQMWSPKTGAIETLYSDEDNAILESIKKAEWQHSKRSYSTEEWQKNNRKKEYRRSAKNHYS